MLAGCPVDCPLLLPDPNTASDVRVQLERFPASEDTDTATQQTVGLMCRYIAESAGDEMVQRAAHWAHATFGEGSADPAMKAWAVWWFVKHHVRFVVDESPMFRLGETGQQDLLISPAVLIRMDDPREDCDGFTMLGAALLKVLGVPFVIVTIAASPDDPGRWSHVFLMAMLQGRPLPLDISHGTGPGWIVPANHTFRWQCWDEQGKEVNVPRPRIHSLNGWVRPVSGFGGLGQDPGDQDPSDPYGDQTLAPPTPASGGVADNSGDVTGYAAPTVPTVGPGGTFLNTSTPSVYTGSSSPSSSSFNWTSFLNTLTTQAAGVAKVAEIESAGTNASLALSGVFSSLMPLLILGIGGYLLISALGNRK